MDAVPTRASRALRGRPLHRPPRVLGLCASEVRTFETLARPLDPRPAPALVADLPGGIVNSSAAAERGTWARPAREMRGHTSYLTFATLLPDDTVQT